MEHRTTTLTVEATTGAASTTSVNFYVNPKNDATVAANQIRVTDPSDAALLDKIGTHENALWLGEWNSNQATVVQPVEKAATAADAIPVYVLYAIPDRDCSSAGYSSGGYSTAAQYETFVRQVKAGINGGRAAVIVEPDALPEAFTNSGCGFTQAQITQRETLIDYASKTLSVPGTSVYLDAGGIGNSGWISQIVPVLQAAGIYHDAGFATNISGFSSTSSLESYGNQLSAALGKVHFVIDTSRNGVATAPTWCNPPGQGLGKYPSTVTDDPLVDGYLWVKFPGQSDGTCNGGPTSGTFWKSYALGLARNAAD